VIQITIWSSFSIHKVILTCLGGGRFSGHVVDLYKVAGHRLRQLRVTVVQAAGYERLHQCLGSFCSKWRDDWSQLSRITSIWNLKNILHWISNLTPDAMNTMRIQQGFSSQHVKVV